MNTVFRLVNPVLDRNTYTFKVNVFIRQAIYEQNTVFLICSAYSTSRATTHKVRDNPTDSAAAQKPLKG